MVNKKAIISQCDEIEQAWRAELEQYSILLKFCGNAEVFTGQVQYMNQLKNHIKRCKWNITRAINIRKKHE